MWLPHATIENIYKDGSIYFKIMDVWNIKNHVLGLINFFHLESKAKFKQSELSYLFLKCTSKLVIKLQVT